MQGVWCQQTVIDWLKFIVSVILRENIKLGIPEETNEFFMLLAIMRCS